MTDPTPDALRKMCMEQIALCVRLGAPDVPLDIIARALRARLSAPAEAPVMTEEERALVDNVRRIMHPPYSQDLTRHEGFKLLAIIDKYLTAAPAEGRPHVVLGDGIKDILTLDKLKELANGSEPTPNHEKSVATTPDKIQGQTPPDAEVERLMKLAREAIAARSVSHDATRTALAAMDRALHPEVIIGLCTKLLVKPVPVEDAEVEEIRKQNDKEKTLPYEAFPDGVCEYVHQIGVLLHALSDRDTKLAAVTGDLERITALCELTRQVSSENYAKLVELQTQTAKPDNGAPQVEVYSRDECIFSYCMDPAICKANNACQSPRR